MSEEIYKKLLEEINIPIYKYENNQWIPLTNSAKHFNPELAEEVVIGEEKFKIYRIDPLYVRGVLHDIRILAQRIEEGSAEALKELKYVINDFLRRTPAEVIKDYTNVCEVLKKIIELYKWEQFKVNCDKLEVYVDQQYLYRVLLNIIDNLYKYSKSSARAYILGNSIIFEGTGNLEKEGEGLRTIKDIMEIMGESVKIERCNGSVKYILSFQEVYKDDSL
ncbi:MAG: hypothetical protein J7L34_02750 [Thermotogaceae bacterium]|nr:hypothetical protein [Thermotogaceae bacterium]